MTHPFHADDVDVDPDRARELIDAGEVQLVDVREPHEWDAGPDRRRAPHRARAPRVARPTRSTATRPVLFYCRLGARSGMAANAFRRAGFDAYSVDGGLTEWDRRGHPLEPDGRHGRRPLMRAALAAALLLLALPAGAAAAPALVPVGTFAEPGARRRAAGDAARAVRGRAPGGIVGSSRTASSLPAPFADLTRPTCAPAASAGCSAIAFPPDYAASGPRVRLPGRAAAGGELADPRAAALAPIRTVAVPGAGRLVLAVPTPRPTNHNGGQLAFGPDGMLYAATGDGGGANDPEDDAANTGIAAREDPADRPARRRRAGPSNPFGNAVWAYGLRNPWRFSFDRATGDLLIGDVGQGVKEEIDWARRADGGGRGVNYGWRCCEGSAARRPASTAPTARRTRVGTQLPAFELDRAPTATAAVIGGFVVRDPGLPTLAGRYLFGDFCRSRPVMSAVLGAAAATERDRACRSPR